MFASLYRFELGFHLRRPLFYLVTFFFGLICFGAITTDGVQVGGAIGNVNRNAPFVIVQMLAVFTAFAPFVVTAFVASAALRDFEMGTHPLFFSKPIRKFDYLVARFLGALTVGVMVYLGPVLAILIGSKMPWLDPERIGPTLLEPYLAGFLFFVVPNLIFIGAVFFTLASLSRSWLYTYLGVVLFFVGFFLAGTLTQDLESQTLAAMLDPFGFAALGELTRYWTIIERNSLTPALEGVLLWNRLLWMAVGLAALAVGYFAFSYSRAVTLSLRRKKKLDDVVETVRPSAASLPAMKPTFDGAASWRQLVQSIRLETRAVLLSIPFLVILSFGLFNLLAGAGVLQSMFGTQVHPVTHLMWLRIQQSFSFLLVIIITFYAGELVWRERSQKVKDVFDATPASNSVFLVSKTVALLLVVIAFLGTGMLASMGYQLYRGYTNFEFDVYAKGLLVNGYPFLLIAVLAIFLQVLSNHKFVGFMLMIVFMLSGIILNAFDLNHNLYNYAGSPGAPYSDMNGYGHFVTGQLWFNLYWTLAALVLTGLAALLWVRGNEGAPRFRLRLARERFRGPVRLLVAVSLVGFVATGAFIFYNTNILNTYVPADEAEEQQAEYEKKYRQYLDIPMPRITAVSVDVDIFPYQRRIEARGTYTLVNKHQEPIRELHFNLATNLEKIELDLPPHTVTIADEVLGYHVYELETPLAPGDQFEMGFQVVVDPPGFVNNGSDTQLVYNGTFFNNFQYFPVMGYQAGRQLVNRNDRRKHGLEPVLRMPKVDDLFARRNTYLAADSDWIDFETTVSTAADQVVVAPGYLQKEWTEGDRRYFHYEMDSPILHFYSYLSARYEVARDTWSNPYGEDVAIEIYYHPGHEYNIDRMIESVKDSLAYFSREFSPYQHRQMRILEFPRYATFAQAFPNTVPFSESIGFIASLDDDPEAIDYVYYVTAHEVAHQWWAHQVIGGNVQGSTMLSETMAQYSALMVMEEKYGKDDMRRFLKYELDNYLRNRGGELIEELPLMLVENQPYIHYRKGSVIMYALRDLVGEAKLNGAIRDYVAEVAFQEPPYTHTPDLLAHIRRVTPPEHQETVSDFFEKITVFDNEVKEATYTAQEDGSYKVRLETASRKAHADGQGIETEAPLDDWVDIGVFGEESEDGPPEVLFFEKRRITEPEGLFEVVVSKKPVRAGIDPYNKLVDRNSDNNRKKVSEADADDGETSPGETTPGETTPGEAAPVEEGAASLR